ncbi:MAG TPA: nucleoside hydrolase [Candidatus Acidoferrales bacterium]|jgi:inosine-uridine nucleoside N-ribohydrolase|nr:nucleoside hydrolase [Candidatus Acidoferrales bacterium]
MHTPPDLLAHSSTFSAPQSSSTSTGKKKVIYDQDHRGPLSTDTVATLMLLQADNIDLLGICTVSCDMWAKQETAYALRLLELMGRTEIPVFMGAQEPLLNTKAEAQLRYQMFGARSLGNEGYLGCFAKDAAGRDELAPLPLPYNRFAQIKAQPEPAADFIIRTIRANPNEVTMYCGGPMTNLALAVMLAPDIVPITKEVIFMGGGLHHSTSSVNVYFDAEAAKIGFRAGWPKFTLVTTDLAEQVHMQDDGKVDAIVARAQSPIADLFREYELKPQRANPQRRSFRMPDEMMVAHVIDPTIFGGYDDMFVDIVTHNDGHYGDTSFWSANWKNENGELAGQNGPSLKAGHVQVLNGIDKKRFRELFTDLMTRPINRFK